MLIQRWPRALLFLGLLTAIVSLATVSDAGAAFGFRKRITVQQAQVSGSSNFADFPVLVSLLDPDLGTTVNGGKVEHPAGYDIVFRAADGQTNLSFEVESYAPTTGKLVAWVKLPTLFYNLDTDFYIYYGDPAIASPQENPVAVWDPAFGGVWHLPEDPSLGAPQMLDSTANANHGTAIGGMPLASQVPGKIGGSLSSDGVDDYINAGTDPSLDVGAGSFTLELWFNTTTTNPEELAGKGSSAVGGKRYLLATGGIDCAVGFIKAEIDDDVVKQNVCSTVGTYNDAAWHHAALVWSGGTLALHLDGVVNNTLAVGAYGSLDSVRPFTMASLFREGSGFTTFYDGGLDEVRLSRVARSVVWLSTQFNNQSSPATFYTIGTEERFGVPNYRSIGTAPDTIVGTIVATAGSSVVTGTGTAWVANNRGRGDRIDIGGTDYTILSVDSNARLTLTGPASGNYSGPYTISRQFATLPAWEDCIDGGPCIYFSVATGDLVLDDRSEVGIAYKDTVFSTEVVIDGATTDGTHTITLTADGDNRHYGVAGNGVVVDIGASLAGAIRVDDEFVTVEWLEITGGSGGAAHGVRYNSMSPSNKQVLRYCLIHDVGGDGILLSDADLDAGIYNNIVYATGQHGIRFNNEPSQAMISNNTIYNSSLQGMNGDGGPGTVLRNNIAHSNVGDFNVTSFSSASSNNLAGDGTGISHSPGGGGLDGVPLVNVGFVSTAPSAEDLHITPGSAAENAGVDLRSLFSRDIDGGVRQLPWEIGADDTLALTSRVAPKISSAINQGFVVGISPQAAADITILDDPVRATITAAKDIRIRIPFGFNMRWNEALTLLGFGGSASGKVDPTVKAYEDFGHTVVLDVQLDFAPGDDLVVSGLGFKSLPLPRPSIDSDSKSSTTTSFPPSTTRPSRSSPTSTSTSPRATTSSLESALPPLPPPPSSSPPVTRLLSSTSATQFASTFPPGSGWSGALLAPSSSPDPPLPRSTPRPFMKPPPPCVSTSPPTS